MPRKRTPDEVAARRHAHWNMQRHEPRTLADALRLLRSYTLNGKALKVSPQRRYLGGELDGYRFSIKGAGMSFSIPEDPRSVYRFPALNRSSQSS